MDQAHSQRATSLMYGRYMRRIISFACFAALLCGGVCLLIIELSFGNHTNGRILMMAVFLIILGGYLLRRDFAILKSRRKHSI